MQRTIDTFPIHEVKGVPVLNPEAVLPTKRAVLDRIMAACPVVLIDPSSDDGQPSLPYNDYAPTGMSQVDDIALWQVSPTHRRSFEIDVADVPDTWHDEFGNAYRGLSVKGNYFATPGIVATATAPDGLIAFGLQESNIIERTVRASHVLRARGIATEYLLGLAEPKFLPWPQVDKRTDASEMLTLKAYKNKLIQRHWSDLPPNDQTADSLLDLHNKFKDMTFILSLRATDSPYRLHDVIDSAIRQKVFSDRFSQQNFPDQAPLDSENYEDLERYLRDYWAPRAADNLARLHTDLVHGFPHGFNMTADGGLVDLDSVHGSGLNMDDAPVTHTERANDIGYVFNAITEMQRFPQALMDITSSVHGSFIESYIESARKHYTGDDPGVYFAGLVTAISTKIRNNSDVIKRHSIIETLEDTYCTQYLVLPKNNEVVTDYIANSLAELENDLAFRDELREHLAGFAAEYVDIAIGEALHILNEKYFEPGMYNFYELFADEKNEMFLEFQAGSFYEIEAYCQKRITVVFASSASPGEPVARLMHLQGDDMRRLAMQKLLKLYSDTMTPSVYQIERLILDDPADIIRTATQYEVPSSLFQEVDSNLNVGLNRGKFWLTTDNVPRKTIDDYLDATKDVVFNEELSYDRLSGIVFSASQPEYRITEVISSHQYDGYSATHDDDTPTVQMHFSEAPDYILIVEQKPDGSRLLRLQTGVEKMTPAHERIERTEPKLF